jgi:hypothetical protein
MAWNLIFGEEAFAESMVQEYMLYVIEIKKKIIKSFMKDIRNIVKLFVMEL